MKSNEYSSGLNDFFDMVIEPTKSFSRIFIYGSKSPDEPLDDVLQYDVGSVLAALGALASSQLRSLASQLESHYGPIEVILPTEFHYPESIKNILPQQPMPGQD